ncbi:Scr1 family TA system antitoxin-like transcriptional regulator [Kitasatospora sp. McL0602]|uniref:Scr1 family TA system antitoxin-like transcriptional regulator n=1 Tax=Kitasatospora sp. McL0602 TaxID=3439530 RepID=UPI003F8BE51A
MPANLAPSSIQQARRALGLRLRDIRKDASLSARALARLAGWHESKCSRIEHGHAAPSDTDIRTWTLHCGVPEQAVDLIATARGIEGAYIEWRRIERSGLKRAQEAVLPLFERTRRFRMYQSWVVPGLLQTPGHTRAVLETIVALRGVHDDVDEAVAVRMERRKVLHTGHHRFAILIEEWVLRTLIGSVDVMAGQLGHLIAMIDPPEPVRAAAGELERLLGYPPSITRVENSRDFRVSVRCPSIDTDELLMQVYAVLWQGYRYGHRRTERWQRVWVDFHPEPEEA